MNLNKFKLTDKGITLVALVITIIVLLILSGVSIAMLTGNNGILTQSNKSKEETRGASVEEEKNLWKANQYLDEYTSSNSESLQELIERLVDERLLTENEKDQILGNEEKGIKATGQVTIGSKTIVFGLRKLTLVDMFKKAEADGCMNLDGTCDNPNHLHIGDYVDYQNPTNGTYTMDKISEGGDNYPSYSVANNQLNWRVLGIDEKTGGLKLISGRTMKDNREQYVNTGAKFYEYGPEEMDKACEIYRNNNYAIEDIRSVNIDDINQVLGIKTEDEIEKYNLGPMASAGWYAQYGDIFKFENQYTPESWLNGKQTTTVSGKVTGYLFFVMNERLEEIPEEPEEFSLISVKNTRAKNMLFDNNNYLLADRCVNSSDNFAEFGIRYVGTDEHGMWMVSWLELFNSDGSKEAYPIKSFQLRPVVILKSDITKDQISKVADKVENS